MLSPSTLLRTAVGCLLLFTSYRTTAFETYYDNPGPYCETSRSGCCLGRQDNCSLPIADTLCYCDERCNRGRDGDCCPDYARFCLNIVDKPEPLIEACLLNGVRFTKFDAPVMDNCNSCKCNSMGDLECEQDKCLVDGDLLHNVNSISDSIGWRAENYTQFWGRKYAEGLDLRLGTKEPKHRVKAMSKLHVTGHTLPSHFNAFDKWSGITAIRDQGWCGSSWAVSTASVASDRYAVQSKGQEVVTLSPQHLLSCVRRQQGCHGGHLDWAWNYFRKIGIVNEECYPYVAATDRCKVRNKDNLRTAGCTLPTTVDRAEKYQVGAAIALKNETDIMLEIHESGPVQATMRVYRDFFTYGGGIYKHTRASRSEPTGFHSVRLVGWGIERGSKYWIAANSWGAWWGEDGFFRIARGTNECEIEDYVLSTLAAVHIKSQGRRHHRSSRRSTFSNDQRSPRTHPFQHYRDHQ